MSILRLSAFFCLFFIPNLFAQIDLGIDTPVGEEETFQIENKNDNSKSFLDTALDFISSNKTTVVPKKNISLDELKEKAEKGDVEAQLDIGYKHLYGIDGVNIDYKQAFHYYEQAAKSNNPVALNNLGSLYFNGIGTNVDYDKAIYYFREASKFGSSDASLNLVIIYLGSDSKYKTTEDWQYIYDLLKKSKDTNIYAKYLLGYAYYVGFLVDTDYQKAFSYIKSVANEQYDEAQYLLANLYIEGKGTTRNYSNAVKYLKMSALQGYKKAIIKLADIYSEGKIYTQDIKEAHVLYNVATTFGSNYAEQKRDELEKILKIEDLLNIQADAENFKLVPSEKTSFVRKTFGQSLKEYIDMNIDNVKNVKISY